MHLSLLSDATLSDLVDDAGRRAGFSQPAASQHLDGLVRGLVFAAALVTPFALAFVPTAYGHLNGTPAHAEVRP